MSVLVFIQEYWVEASTAIGGVSAWLYERKQRILDRKKAEMSHSESIIDMYEEALDDIPEQFEKRIDNWQRMYENLEKELEICRAKNSKNCQ